jgi:hypothetical protein
LIAQPDHAALSGRVMELWVTRGLPGHERRDSILHAVYEHDNGWREVDAAPLVGADGRLLDFVTAPIEVRQGIWPRGARRLAADPIAAALVAEHAIYIYRRFQGDPAWREFFTEMALLRTEFAAGAGLSLDDLARDYFFLRAADLISLVFCAGWTEPQQIGDCLIRLDAGDVVVTPDPFEGRAVPLEVPARALPNRPFRSPAEAESLFRTAGMTGVIGTVRGGSAA